MFYKAYLLHISILDIATLIKLNRCISSVNGVNVNLKTQAYSIS